MGIFQKTVDVKTKKMYDFVQITQQVRKVVSESKIKNGVVFVNALHTTAAVILQENDSSIHRDLIRTLDKIVSMNEKYEHDYEGNENATAHLKQNLLGNSVNVPIKDDKLVTGSWQEIFFVELFEPRNRKVVVTVIGE